MSAHNTGIEQLKGDLLKAMERMERLNDFYNDFVSRRGHLKEHAYDLIILSEIFVDFYTCVETAFVRISKFFENNLDGSRWHADLLERMTVDVPDVRPRVISDFEHTVLLEFLRFRHFKRYYFHFEYDRDKMSFLEKEFRKIVPKVKNAFITYTEMLGRLDDSE